MRFVGLESLLGIRNQWELMTAILASATRHWDLRVVLGHKEKQGRGEREGLPEGRKLASTLFKKERQQ